VSRQNGRDIRPFLDLSRQVCQIIMHDPAKRQVEIIEGHILVKLMSQQPVAVGVRYGGHLQGLASTTSELMDLFPVGHDHPRHIQYAENVNTTGGQVGRGQIVIANQQDHRHALIGQPLEPAGKLALKGGIRALILISIAGKNTNINLTFKGNINSLTKPAQEIYDSAVQARFRIEPAIVFDTDMKVG
jgi:hypothetical protein